MNKFLQEQLLDFNKETNDQYQENWGSILNFVHEDPNSQGNKNKTMNRNNSGIDTFQKQMRDNEEQMLEEQARLEAEKNMTNNTAAATKYHQDEKERIKALVEEFGGKDGNFKLSSQNEGISRRFEKPASQDTFHTRGMSQNLSNQSIEMDRSIQGDISLQVVQQVSFQQAFRGQSDEQVAFVNNRSELRSPQTPCVIPSVALENATNHQIDEQDLKHEQHGSGQKLKSIVKRTQHVVRNQQVSMIDEYCDYERSNLSQDRPSMGNQSSTDKSIPNSAEQDFNAMGDAKRRRRTTIQQNKVQVLDKKDDSNHLWNTQKDQSLFTHLRAMNEKRGLNNSHLKVNQMRSLSPFTQNSTNILPMECQSPSMYDEPINLANLQSMNLRHKLMQRLQQFNDKASDNQPPNDLDSNNRMNSTQDSLFFNNEAQSYNPRNQRHAQTGHSFGDNTRFAYQQPPVRVTKSQFLKKHGKHLAQSSYMQSMMRIQEDLVEKQQGRKMSYQLMNKHRRDSHGVHQSGSQMQKLANSQHTASFGASYQRSSHKHQARQTFDGRSQNTGSRFASQMRGAQSPGGNIASKFTVHEYDLSQADVMMPKVHIRDGSNLDHFNAQRGSHQLMNGYIHQNHPKVVSKSKMINKQQGRGSRGKSMSSLPFNTALNFNQLGNFDTDQHSNTQYYEQDGQPPVEAQEQTFKRLDSDDDLNTSHYMDMNNHLGSFGHPKTNMVPVPNQSNAFFASGFKMVDSNTGELENIYSNVADRVYDADTQSKILQNYQGKPVIDRTQKLLKRLQMTTPGTNVNISKLERIQQQAHNKVAYTYKERFCGVHDEQLKNGMIKRDSSWDKFVNPDKIGLNNHLQHALNSEAGEQQKHSAQEQEEEPKPLASQPSGGNLVQNSQRGDATRSDLGSNRTKQIQGPKTIFRNALERFHHQFDGERVENINDNTTFDRIQKANKKFEIVIQRAKPSVKLYNLLGYSQTQYILFRQIQHWMRQHKYSDKKQTDNINNIQFAREFFAIIDDSDSGQASLFQLAVPMIALGLSSDSSFIRKVMSAISPAKFGKKAKVSNPFEVNQLTLKEFVKIFRKDQISENLTEMLCDRMIERRKKEAIAKKRDIEKRKQQLSILKGKSTVYTVNQVDPDEERKSNVQRTDSPTMKILEMAAEDSSEIDIFQRADAATNRQGGDKTTSRQSGRGKEATAMSQVKEVKEPTEAQMLQQLSQISINDMLGEVHDLWFFLDQERGLLELDMLSVCQLFCSLKVMQDVSSAQKYIETLIQRKTSQLDYDDFNSIFCKGIFKHSIVSKAHQIETEMAQSSDANPEEKLEFKMVRTKIQNLKGEINLGRIDTADQQAQLVVRPILSELWAIFYKNVPREQRETYEQFFNRMQGLTSEIVKDPTSIELDAFASKSHSVKQEDTRARLSQVVQDNFDMARSPYQVDEDTHIKAQAQKPVTSHSVGRRQSRFGRKKSDVTGTKAAAQGHRNISGKTSQRSNEQSFKKKTIQSQMGSKERNNNLETKSQMSTATGKSKNNNNRCDTKDSHRTEATSTKQNLAKSSYSGVKFYDDEQSNYRNLDLKLSENVDEIMLQRKQRFEQLQKMQELMTRSQMGKPPGQDFLDAIQKRKEEERQVRLKNAEENQA